MSDDEFGSRSRWSTLSVASKLGRVAASAALGRSAHQKLAGEIASQLDEMKGLAMKLGQILSYLDAPIPEELKDKLAKLQSGVKGMSAERSRRVVEDSLGESIETLFDSFEREPFAAASIGQVHHATLEGRDVVVKVQYPGVRSSFAKDVRFLRRFAGLASIASSVQGGDIVDELAARLSEECDYEREARWQTAFGERLERELSNVRSPRVRFERSAERVLTSERVDGFVLTHLSRVEEGQRESISMRLVEIAYRSITEWGACNADPHPGNFIVGEDVLFALDYGCVRTFDHEFVSRFRELSRAVLDEDKPRFREAVIACGFAPKPKRFDFEHHMHVMRHLYRPFTEPHFMFEAGFVRQGMELNGPTNPNVRHLALPPEWVWIQRLQWGLWSVLARLGASGDYRGILRESLDRPIDLLRT